MSQTQLWCNACLHALVARTNVEDLSVVKYYLVRLITPGRVQNTRRFCCIDWFCLSSHGVHPEGNITDCEYSGSNITESDALGPDAESLTQLLSAFSVGSCSLPTVPEVPSASSGKISLDEEYGVVVRVCILDTVRVFSRSSPTIVFVRRL